MEKLKNFAGSNQQSLAGFEKIRTVGKGNCLIHDLKYSVIILSKQIQRLGKIFEEILQSVEMKF